MLDVHDSKLQVGMSDPNPGLEWILGMWANCPNVGSLVSLGLFEGENKSKYFRKSLTQLCM